MDQLKLMKTFKLAIDEGSIAKASIKLRISKAAASKQLIQLENKLNVQLLHRTTRQLRMTDAGQLFYDSLNNVFSAIADAESVVTHINDKPKGSLKIASHRHFGEKFIIPNIKEFIDLYPDLKLDIELSDRFPDMEKENFDVLCGIGHEGPDHLVRRKIATVRHVLCASPDYLRKAGMPQKPDDLKKLHYITHSFRNPDILSFKNNRHIHLDFSIRVNDAQTMLKCAMDNLGFIKIFNYFVEDHIKSGKLIEILKPWRDMPKSLYIFYQQHKFLPIKIRLFIDFLIKKIHENKLDVGFSVRNP